MDWHLITKKYPLIKNISAIKVSGESWGVELFFDSKNESVKIGPSKTEVCKLPVLKHQYNIL